MHRKPLMIKPTAKESEGFVWDPRSNEGSPGISRFPVFYRDVCSDYEANRGRFFLGKNVNASVNDERALTGRIVCEPHFLQTFAGKTNLAIRRRSLGSIFDG